MLVLGKCDLNHKLDIPIRLLYGLVAHTCNTTYSGSKDQEDRGSKPVLGR
jgi:hypothetical protein